MPVTLERGIALQRRGRLAEAEAVYRQLLARSPLDAQALHYLGLVNYQAGRFELAEGFLSRAVSIDQGSANTWNDLGVVRLKSGKVEASVGQFVQALQISPAHCDALNNLSAALRQLFRFESALPPLRALAQLRPHSAEVMRTLADTLYHAGQTDESIEVYRDAIRLEPSCAEARLGLAEACEAAGRFTQARWQYEAILRRQPGQALALSKLLQLRDGITPETHLANARRCAELLDTPIQSRIRLDIGLAYHFDRGGEYDSAFHHLQRARSRQAQLQPFNSAGYRTAVNGVMRILDRDFFNGAPTSGLSTDRPIFILGMPRSGTTLTEQILASHPQVTAGGELAALPAASYLIEQVSTDRQPYPAGLTSVPQAALRELADGYLKRTEQIDPSARHVTDKLPFNFMHVGVIRQLFPNARIVHCRRDPMDNCTSCYFTSFAEEVAFANDLSTLGNYYADYRRLMQHWRGVISSPMFELDYEDLVSDTEATIRALLDYLGLDWHDDCLRFYATQRGVRTPSRWQVRQPIYHHSVARWRRYERHLAPLITALGAEIDRCPI